MQNFAIYFYAKNGTRLNQIVNVWMVNCLSFSICYFQLGKTMFTKLLLNKQIDDSGNCTVSQNDLSVLRP